MYVIKSISKNLYVAIDKVDNKYRKKSTRIF